MAKSIFVFGASGMAGLATTEFLKSQGHPVYGLTRKDFDISKDSNEKLLNLLGNAQAVVNCAGVIKPQIAKLSIEEVLKVNAIFPRNLARACHEQATPCIHLTTDCVYTGKTGSYNEASLFDATDVYGMSKNAGDTDECMTIRTSIIGEERGQARSLIAWAQSQKGKTVNGFRNHIWNGITTLQFAKVCEAILTQGLYRKGVFHVHSPSAVTKAEMLRIFSRVYDLDLKVNEIDAPDFCDRSLASLAPLSSDLVTATVEQQVIQLRDFFRKI